MVNREICIIEIRLDNPSKYGDADLYIFEDGNGERYGFFNRNLKKQPIKVGDRIKLLQQRNKYGSICYVADIINANR